ncbi:MAG TPA: hypothetical protein VKZ53_22810 [Candidatus Angelobacter sp.]|nr:hypothetical protein [Candidatus Angelobacter sp.]
MNTKSYRSSRKLHISNIVVLLAALSGIVALAVPPPDHNREAPVPYRVSEKVQKPRIFGEGVISTVADEIGGAFSPDGTEFYFSQLSPYTTLPRLGLMCVSRYRQGHWNTPEVLPFSGRYLDYPPKFDKSGKRMLFASSRPLPDGSRGAIRIWEVEKTPDGWSQPQPLPPPINKPDSYWNADPSLTSDGTLYFSSDREGRGSLHIYRARFVDGKYAEPEKLGREINSEFTDYQPYVSPDEKLLLFTSVGSEVPPFNHRPEELTGGGRPYARGDLYVSYNHQGKWSVARHLEHNINTIAEEEFPFLSPDGRYLFFSSERSPFEVPVAKRLDYRTLERQLHSIYNGHGNIFFIDVDAIDKELELPK